MLRTPPSSRFNIAFDVAARHRSATRFVPDSCVLATLQPGRLTGRPESARSILDQPTPHHGERRPARRGHPASHRPQRVITHPGAAKPANRPDRRRITGPRCLKRVGRWGSRYGTLPPQRASLRADRWLNTSHGHPTADRRSGIAVKRASQSPLRRARPARRWSAIWPAMRTGSSSPTIG